MIHAILFLAALATTELKLDLGDDGVAALAKYRNLQRLTITGAYDSGL